MNPSLLYTTAATCLLMTTACKPPAETTEKPPEEVVKTEKQDLWLDISSLQQTHLNIELTEVRLQQVGTQMLLPAHLKMLPESHASLHVSYAGKIDWQVTPGTRVAANEHLAWIDSKDWRTDLLCIQNMQNDLQGLAYAHDVLKSNLTVAQAALATAQLHAENADALAISLEERVVNLRAANIRQADIEQNAMQARADAQEALAQLAIADASLQQVQSQIEQSTANIELMSQKISVEAAILAAAHPTATAKQLIESPESYMRLPLIAPQAGTLMSWEAQQSSWIEPMENAGTVANLNILRAVGTPLLSQLPNLQEGMLASVQYGDQQIATSAIAWHPYANESTHIPQIYCDIAVPENSYARPGMSVTLDVTTDAGKRAPVIPSSALVWAGTQWLYYVQNKTQNNLFMPTPAHIGIRNDDWVEITAGLLPGDKVVSRGAYALLLSQGGSMPEAPEGYHYHADGTLHSDDAH